jgi:hypothetical protein
MLWEWACGFFARYFRCKAWRARSDGYTVICVSFTKEKAVNCLFDLFNLLKIN